MPDDAVRAAIEAIEVRGGGRLIPDAVAKALEEALEDVYTKSSLFEIAGMTRPQPYGTQMETDAGSRGMALGEGSVFCYGCGEVEEAPEDGGWKPASDE